MVGGFEGFGSIGRKEVGVVLRSSWLVVLRSRFFWK